MKLKCALLEHNWRGKQSAVEPVGTRWAQVYCAVARSHGYAQPHNTHGDHTHVDSRNDAMGCVRKVGSELRTHGKIVNIKVKRTAHATGLELGTTGTGDVAIGSWNV